jgi:hypothetical protein
MDQLSCAYHFNHTFDTRHQVHLRYRQKIQEFEGEVLITILKVESVRVEEQQAKCTCGQESCKPILKLIKVIVTKDSRDI